jgi:hypothetical protein
MSRRSRRGRSAGPPRALPLLVAVVAFGFLGTLPLTLKALNLHIKPFAPTASYGVPLLPAPAVPRPVHLPTVARPVDPDGAPAQASLGNVSTDAAVVSAEDARLRALLHDAVRIYQPVVLPYRGALPTLVLTAGSRPYTISDLVQYGALVLLPHHAALLIDNVFVSTNATLIFKSPLRALYLDSSPSGFASIVSWNGNLRFQGTGSHPLTIMGWNRLTKSPATDRGYGRAYIRDVGGKMNLADVRASSLGFWSGRTGGVAWTGITKQPSTGGAIDSTFTDDTYGAFVSRGANMKFVKDLFEFNQLDGLHIHRFTVGTTIVQSSASRNGGNGFLVDQATQDTLLRYDISQHNAANGFLVNGRPLTLGASASGNAVQPAAGTKIERSEALANGKSGILVEGGKGTVLAGNDVCTSQTGIAARTGAADTVITGNYVRCRPRSGLSIGPLAPGTVASGNTVVASRIGVLVRNSGSILVDNNVITGATVFGITARGSNTVIHGVGNTFSGTGFRAVDGRADAPMPSLYGSKTAGWAHRIHITFWLYLEFHPLAALWLGILTLLLLCYLWSRRRRLPPHPYPASTRWRPGMDTLAGTAAAEELVLAGAVATGLPAGVLTVPPPAAVPRPALSADDAPAARAPVHADASPADLGAERASLYDQSEDRLGSLCSRPSAPTVGWQERPATARYRAGATGHQPGAVADTESEDRLHARPEPVLAESVLAEPVLSEPGAGPFPLRSDGHRPRPSSFWERSVSIIDDPLASAPTAARGAGDDSSDATAPAGPASWDDDDAGGTTRPLPQVVE